VLDDVNTACTLFFSDIEGSTALLHKLGSHRYSEALEQQRALLRREFARWGGQEAGCEGDSFFVAFPTAVAAVEAAAGVQRALAAAEWPEGLQVRVRIGIHTGTPLRVEGSYVGTDVHQAARIMAAAHGGQVLLSEATAAQLNGAAVRDLGVHELKDITQPIRLFQLEGAGLGELFPAVRTLANRPTNLPAHLPTLIGRTGERADIARLLGSGIRLLTLTGTGGIGKTRLALEIAADHREVFPDGVYFVDLAPITDPELVLPAIAQAIGITEGAAQSLSAYLGQKRILVVTDNFEQVLPGAPKVGQLLALAPNLAVLATCRGPLRLRGERVYPLSPLPTPGLLDPSDAGSLARYPASALFVERAQDVDPGFALTAENAVAIAEICVRLDGLPLAIELAATRTALLTPHELLARLDSRLALLTDGPQDLPSRQRTLRSTLAWSYDLLDPDQRELFARLGVFAGGFTLSAAEHIADATLARLAALVDASLVRRQQDRYGMLETMREYALDRLTHLELDRDTRDRHAAYYERLAASGDGSEPQEHYARLTPEFDNFRGALDHVHADPARQLQLMVQLDWLWPTSLAEGQARVVAALQASPEHNATRAHALDLLTRLAGERGQLDLARASTLEAAELWRELGEPKRVVHSYDTLRWACLLAGDESEAHAAAVTALQVAREVGDAKAILDATSGVLHVLLHQHDLRAFDPLLAEMSDRLRANPDPELDAVVHALRAEAALLRGDTAQAIEGFQKWLAFLGQTGNRTHMALAVACIAVGAADSGRDEFSVRLFSVARAELESSGFVLDSLKSWPYFEARYLDPARERLGDAAAHEAWEHGHGMSFETAVALALQA
jgi:predicted ATPase/class 3 adenylate cyclase